MINCYHISEGFVTVSVIIANSVVVTSVGIKRVICIAIQSKFNGSNIFKTLEICFEPLRVDHIARYGDKCG